MGFCYVFKIKYLMNNRFADFTFAEFFPELVNSNRSLMIYLYYTLTIMS